MEEDLSSTEDAWPGPCCFWHFRTLRRDKHTSSAPRCDNNKAQMNLPTLSKELRLWPKSAASNGPSQCL